MKKLLLLPLLALLAAVSARAQPARSELVARVESCEAILQEFQSRRHLAIPPAVWQRAKAIVVLNQFKAGFLLGVQDGYGIIMVKKPDGRWSIPVIINANEASLGFQLGAKAVESVFIITDDAMPRLLFTQRFNIGVDAKAVAGPRAAETERINENLLRTPMLAYTKAVGLYAGATVKAGHISRNDKANFDPLQRLGDAPRRGAADYGAGAVAGALRISSSSARAASATACCASCRVRPGNSTRRWPSTVGPAGPTPATASHAHGWALEVLRLPETATPRAGAGSA